MFSAEFSWLSLLRSSVYLETEISLHIYHILGSNERDDYLAGLGWRSHKNTEENVRKNVCTLISLVLHELALLELSQTCLSHQPVIKWVQMKLALLLSVWGVEAAAGRA